MGNALESHQDRKKRVRAIVARLRKFYPAARCSLVHENPYQLMVATILSAQCTDERVNMVMPKLIRRFPTVVAIAQASQEAIEEVIRSTGFYRNKAKSIHANALALLQNHGGEVPRTLAELTLLPGVGRKTASVVLGAGFGLTEGIVVDTHVMRIAHALGLTHEKSAEKIEQDLMDLLPRKDWIEFTHLIIFHGRAVCVARRPRCTECFLASLCPTGGGSVSSSIRLKPDAKKVAVRQVRKQTGSKSSTIAQGSKAWSRGLKTGPTKH